MLRSVPHGLDPQSFRPHDPTMAREILGLPRDKKIVLYGASKALADPNKGFLMFCNAVKKLALDGFGPEVEIVVFGASTPLDPPNLHLKTSYAGVLYDDVTCLYYIPRPMCL